MEGRVNEVFANLGTKKVLLFIIDPKRYLEMSMEITRNSLENKGAGFYVALNKPFVSLRKTFKQNKLDTDRIFFIDGVTKTIGPGEFAHNVTYMDNQNQLKMMNYILIEVTKSIPRESKFIIIDALSTMRVYNDDRKVSRFLHMLINRTRLLGFRIVLLSTQKEIKPEVVKQFADKIIDLSDMDG